MKVTHTGSRNYKRKNIDLIENLIIDLKNKQMNFNKVS